MHKIIFGIAMLFIFLGCLNAFIFPINSTKSVPNVYIGGNYRASTTNGVMMNGIGMFDTNWNALGEGLFDSGTVNKMMINDTSLFFVGHFRWNKNRDVNLFFWNSNILKKKKIFLFH